MTRTLTAIQADIAALTNTSQRYTAGLNEGGEGFNPHHAALRALRDEEDAILAATADARSAAILAEREALWTLELTTQRRAEWNAWVRRQGKMIAPAKVADQIKAQGWGMDDLKRAITRHGL